MRHRSVDRDSIFAVSEFIKKLNDEGANGALVVVEGRRDAEALKALGFRGELFMLCHHGTILKLLEKAEAYQKAILLFDLDSEGRLLTKKAATLLEERKMVVDLSFRRELAMATNRRVKHVEELSSFKDKIPIYS